MVEGNPEEPDDTDMHKTISIEEATP